MMSDTSAKNRRVCAPRTCKADFPQSGVSFRDDSGNYWVVGSKLNQGGTSVIFTVSRKDKVLGIPDNDEHVMKLEPKNGKYNFVNKERDVLREINRLSSGRTVNIPKCIASGEDKGFRFIILPRFEIDLLAYSCQEGKSIKPNQYARAFCLQMLELLEYIHSCGYLHSDLKPENIMIQPSKTKRPSENKYYMVDFGFARKYTNKAGHPIKLKKSKNTTGTIDFMSTDCHNGFYTQRGELESFGFIVLELLYGILPWDGVNGSTEVRKVQLAKQRFFSNVNSSLAKECPEHASLQDIKILEEYFVYVMSLRDTEKPNYDRCRNILGQLDEYLASPIDIGLPARTRTKRRKLTDFSCEPAPTEKPGKKEDENVQRQKNTLLSVGKSGNSDQSPNETLVDKVCRDQQGQYDISSDQEDASMTSPSNGQWILHPVLKLMRVQPDAVKACEVDIANRNHAMDAQHENKKTRKNKYQLQIKELQDEISKLEFAVNKGREESHEKEGIWKKIIERTKLEHELQIKELYDENSKQKSKIEEYKNSNITLDGAVKELKEICTQKELQASEQHVVMEQLKSQIATFQDQLADRVAVISGLESEIKNLRVQVAEDKEQQVENIEAVRASAAEQESVTGETFSVPNVVNEPESAVVQDAVIEEDVSVHNEQIPDGNKTADQKKLFTCPRRGCGVQFSRRQNMTRHWRGHSKAKHICSECGLRFNRPDHLLSHKNHNHNGLKEWECRFCYIFLMSAKTIDNHERKKHGTLYTQIHTRTKKYPIKIVS